MTETAPPRPTLPVDLAGSADHLTPILGRYFERSWSHGEGHRLYDTSGRAYLDFANGIAVTALGHHHPAVTAAIHAQVDRLIGPTGAMGYAEPVVRLSSMLARHPPRPDRQRDVPELGLGGDRRRAEARPPSHRPAGDRRVPWRLPRPDVRGDERHDIQPELPDRLRAAPAGGLFRAVPGRLPGVRRRRGTRIGGRPRDPPVPVHDRDRAVAGRVDPDRARPRRGRLQPGCSVIPPGPPPRSATSTGSCSSRTRSRPGSPGPVGCGASSTPGSSRTSW